MKHKQVWISVLVFGLCVAALAGCKGKDTPAQPEEPAAEKTAGGWTISSEAAAPAMPDTAKEAFDAAVAETDADYEPLGFLGSQVVAGSNYGFLCRTTKPETKLCIVKVYRDLEGKASITETKDVAISDYIESGDVNYLPDNLSGGWNIDPELGAAALPEAVQTAFDKATADLTGVGYQPVAYLGSQVVAGSNFAVLCKAASVTAEPKSGLAVIRIYADLEGGAQITSVCGFDFP